MYSHHTHSGDYSQHGYSPLNDMVERASQLNFKTFCLTEHMPRLSAQYLYPEEIHSEDAEDDVARLLEDWEKFVEHARRIQLQHKDDPLKIIVGAESESCDTEQIEYCKSLQERYSHTVKFFVGSVHHVNGIPIDFDSSNWNRALESCGNNLLQLITRYYETQYEMLQLLKPKIVGHFDLYKLHLPEDLKVDTESGQVTTAPAGRHVKDNEIFDLWPSLEQLVLRNLQFISDYGGILEVNTSALRKGLQEPYPGLRICQLNQLHGNGKFVLSDDSHSVDQVGTHYGEAIAFLRDTVKLSQLHYLQLEGPEEDQLVERTVPITEIISQFEHI
ncbi:histidinol-phosphatase KNAG_0C02050 [Huiozyma naganishii CBS 8797]|uniref:Histidinol-phosphatase n=1 Tax=Huiozyma naganishii (strain ATCC MYA-139 / BCRC 22969 / CBS 8797 / KCTC 17520 / NBRC 10181 / NCYC 3082 / Yp74L-3) TaxID=1071383 RepID=J7RWD9_HUIN7|nr:hypothetical protein KNAG_0C02050 [Kazachstania naganishii CBS 8797]CCK69317.1 hypothetical protein KNAG_0C02050 [Kazachstania naganishii CBS 8797]